MSKVKIIGNIHINYIHEVNNEEQIKELKENSKQFTEKANKELIEVLSDSLGVPKDSIKAKLKYEVVEE